MDEKGQSLVEFAVILPILVLLLMGVFEFGMLFNGYLTIQNASREGARLASVGGSDGEIVSAVIDISPNIDESRINVEISPVETVRKRGDGIQVKVNYQYEVINPVMRRIIGSAIPLHAQTVMRME